MAAISRPSSFAFFSVLASLASAQQPGPLTPEVHPKLSSEYCTTADGCRPINSSIVLDSNYRWLHTVDGYTNCVTQGFDASICPDVETCAKNCALEGVDYSTYGIKTEGNSLTLNLYVEKETGLSLSSPRVYLLDENDETYYGFKLLNHEFTFDVDVSKVPCGINGALYFSEMSLDGDASELNKAGAKYGTGYCDAQCPSQNFVKGRANLNGTYGACCGEMDIWEANNAATAFTPHPCNITGVYACTEPQCGSADRYSSVCDKDGCDFNPYRNGDKSFYAASSNTTGVDSSRPFTIVTQFLTADNSPLGPLTEIRRLYVQDGAVVQNARVVVEGLEADDSITDEYCAAQKGVFNNENAFAALGGLKGMGESLGRGVVLAMSIWHDATSYMLWLDSITPPDADPATPGVARGSCSTSSGRPEDLIRDHPDAAVTFSKIRSGDIGSTFTAGGANATTSTTLGRRVDRIRHS